MVKVRSLGESEILLLGSKGVEELSRDLDKALCSWCRVTRVSLQEAVKEPTSGNGSLNAMLARPLGAAILVTATIGEDLVASIGALRRQSPELPLMVATDDPRPERMIELLELGVEDFATPPFLESDLRPRLWRLIGPACNADELTGALQEKLALQQLVGRSPSFLEAVERVPPMAGCDATVLIQGETGTGKEVFARAIHYLSSRCESPFIPVNCGAIPVELVENELFGHERAAFTGASARQQGLIREAEGGTLFLDEVDALPLAAQVKLLRFLEEKEYRPLGSPKSCSADVRLIAATNTDLERKLRDGEFREDLFYRLNVLPLRIPPLRNRPEDIPLLARHFLAAAAAELGKPAPRASPEALQALLRHQWPGNVRELKHLMERAVVFAGERRVIRDFDVQLPQAREAAAFKSFKRAKAQVVERFERGYVEDLLLVHEGNICRAARAAKKNRRAFWELIRKHGIDAARFRTELK